MSVHYPTLFSPIRLGKHTIRNRVWMAAHATLLVKDHLFTQAHLDYYAERARHGGAAEAACIRIDEPRTGARA